GRRTKCHWVSSISHQCDSPTLSIKRSQFPRSQFIFRQDCVIRKPEKGRMEWFRNILGSLLEPRKRRSIFAVLPFPSPLKLEGPSFRFFGIRNILNYYFISLPSA